MLCPASFVLEYFTLNLRCAVATAVWYNTFSMKFRIQGNSIRLRLSAADVSQLQQTGTIVKTLIFGPAED